MILVDPPAWEARGRVWSHVASDTSYAELHEFAARVGLHPLSYDGDHYDVPSERYEEVLAAGAVPSSAREILTRVHAAGLRFRKRRGERPLAAIPDGLPYLPVSHRLDLIASDREPPEETTVAAVTFVADERGRTLLIRSTHRDSWEGPGGWREPGEPVRDGAARELREESGMQVAPGDLAACAYERIILHEELTSGPGAGRLHPVSHIAVFAATVAGSGPASAHGPEGHELGWFGGDELESRCGGSPWWPILARLRRADGSHASRARPVR